LEIRTEQGKHTRREIRKKEGRDSTLRGKSDKKYIPNDNGLANCITTGKESIEKWTILPKNKRIRKLTPIECARLQGFPDNWHKGVSDSQAYKCYGNAVTVKIVVLIAQSLKEV